MKIPFIILLVILAVLASGCTAPAPSSQTTTAAVTPAAPAIPDLTGTWTGTMLGYGEGKGFDDYPNQTITMVVTEQRGRIFAGHFVFRLTKSEYTVPMAGILGSNGRTLSLVENANGYTFGEITAKDEIQLTHLDDADPFGVALDTLKRV